MLITCKCLNIYINTFNDLSPNEDNDGLKINVDLERLQQQNKIKADHLQFFRETYGPIRVTSINIKLLDLVVTIPIERWNLSQCINCDSITHAEHNNLFLINSSLLTNQEEINFKLTNEHYSKTFGIIVDPNSYIDFIEMTYTSDVLIENKIKNLSQIVTNEMQRELEETTKRIRRYEEQQLTLFKVAREKTDQEYQVLINLLKTIPADTITSRNINNADNFGLKLSTNLETPPPTPDSAPMSIESSPNFNQQNNMNKDSSSLKQTTTPNKINNLSQNSTSASQQQRHSTLEANDSEIMFDLEGIDNINLATTTTASPTIISHKDNDEDEDIVEPIRHIEGMTIPRQLSKQRSANMMPQSLPIAMPILSNRAVVINDFEEYADDDNIDIAASIKALARSVHGDAVFGDLPRPRFSTKI